MPRVGVRVLVALFAVAIFVLVYGLVFLWVESAR